MATTARGTQQAGRRRRGITRVPTSQSNQDDTERYYELRDALKDQIDSQRNETVALSSDVKGVQGQLTNIYTKLDLLASKLEQSQKTNWPVIGLLVTIILAIIPGGWFVVTNAVSNAILPVRGAVDQVIQGDAERDRKIYDMTAVNTTQSRELSNIQQQVSVLTDNQKRNIDSLGKLSEQAAGSSVADAQSRQDRISLNERVRSLEGLVQGGSAERKNAFAEVGAQLREVEQQFKALSNLNNILTAHQLSFNAQIYEEVYPGKHYPAITFFPQSIFQDNPGPLISK